MNSAVWSTVVWRKSSRSGDTGGQCIEMAGSVPVVAVRDSKDPHGPMIVLAGAAWDSLAREIKSGVHDLA
jgi:hypothetical protein